MSCLGPNVKVVNDGDTIDRHIEYAQSFTIGTFTTACAMPRFDKIKFNTISAIRNRQII